MVFPNLFVLLLAFLSLISCLLSGSNSHAPPYLGLSFTSFGTFIECPLTQASNFCRCPHACFSETITTPLLLTTFSPVPLQESLCTEDMCRIMLILKSLHYQLQRELRAGKTFLKQIFDEVRWSWHTISCTDSAHSHSYPPKEYKPWWFGPLIAESWA